MYMNGRDTKNFFLKEIELQNPIQCTFQKYNTNFNTLYSSSCSVIPVLTSGYRWSVCRTPRWTRSEASTYTSSETAERTAPGWAPISTPPKRDMAGETASRCKWLDMDAKF